MSGRAETNDPAEVIIVGGGPAGLSAALLLGRCRRRVLLFDANTPRNAASRSVHGFLSRDGIPPGEFRKICLEQLRAYPNVRCHPGRIVAADTAPDGAFIVRHENDSAHRCRKLLLATGIADVLPKLDGIEKFYGRSAFHCPICDGWEQQNQPLVVCGSGSSAFEYVTEILTWSREVTLCTEGPSSMEPAKLEKLRRRGVRVTSEKISRLAGEGTQLEKIILADGSAVECRAFFFCSEEKPQSDLAIQLGAEVTEDGRVKENRSQATNVPGLFVAGNTARGVQLAIVAAAEGAKAALAISDELNRENLEAP